jgi:tellurite resistance protein
MEIAIGVIFWVIVIGFFVIRWIARNSDTGSVSIPSMSGGPRNTLEARVKWVEPNDDLDIGHYSVQFRGDLPLPVANRVYVHHFLGDTTDGGDAKPVIALLDWQQASDSIAFFETTDLGYVEYGEYLNLDTWTDLGLNVFPEMVKAPFSGQRKMTAIVSIETASGDVVWARELPFVAELPVPGYIEDKQRERVDDGLIVRVGIAVAASDGDIVEEELEVVRDWSQSRIAYLDDDDPDRAERADVLNAALRVAVEDAQAGRLDLGATISALFEDGSEAGRVEAVELGLAVMRVDGMVDNAEMAVINRLAQQLEVDETWFADNRDKSLSGITLSSASATDYAAVLGIDMDASEDTIRRQLNALYDKWSSRAVSVEDPEKRREAEEMLETIAKARQELLG